MATVAAIRHVLFEDLGLLASVFESRGLAIEYLDATAPDDLERALDSDILVILGGPIGAYEEAIYPFVTRELRVIERRLSAEKPTLGICLGAQLMARVLGARVYAGDRKEIGWSSLTLTTAGYMSPLRHLGGEDTQVLHWHGDTFDLPEGAVLLASTDVYSNQAFSWKSNALGLQFHAEVLQSSLERWYVGHSSELASAKIGVPELRALGLRHAPILERQGKRCFEHWLDELCVAQTGSLGPSEGSTTTGGSSTSGSSTSASSTSGSSNVGGSSGS